MGSDRLTGNTLNNILIGGPGPDTLTGADGSDMLIGGLGSDVYLFANVLSCVMETDKVVEFSGNVNGVDVLDFNGMTTAVTVDLTMSTSTAMMLNRTVEMDLTVGNDVLNIENVYGGSWDDILIGNAVANRLFGRAGSDSMTGGDGNDTYYFSDPAGLEIDTVVENNLPSAGRDTLDFGGLTMTTPVTADLTLDLTTATMGVGLNTRTVRTGPSVTGLVANIENLFGGAGGDSLTGNDAINVFIGGPENDTMTDGKGNDIYRLDDASSSGEVDEVVELPGVGEGTDRLDFAIASVPVVVDLTGSTPTTVGNRTISPSSSWGNLENVVGGSGNDILIGNALANSLDGRDGNDILVGGLGADSLNGNAGEDIAIAGTTSTLTTTLYTNWIAASFSVATAISTNLGGALVPANVSTDTDIDTVVSAGDNSVDWLLADTLGGTNDSVSMDTSGSWIDVLIDIN